MMLNKFNTSEKVFIIAEIGNNHEGSFELAQEMVHSAYECGVDAVKFQTYLPEDFISCENAQRLERLRSFQLSYAQFEYLACLAKERGLEFISTPLDLQSAQFLNTIQSIFKIASGDNNFTQLIQLVMSFDKPIMISTGLTTLAELEKIYRLFKTESKLNLLTFLHCVSSYPVPPDQANISAINTLKKRFTKAKIGYSDHVIGIDAAIYSVAAGARILEKHFTLDKRQSSFRDHQLSADPDEMKTLVREVRKLEILLGNGKKLEQPCENAMKTDGRRSIAARRDLPAGHTVSFPDLTWVRPGSGFTPGSEESVIGRVLRRKTLRGQIFREDDFLDPQSVTSLET